MTKMMLVIHLLQKQLSLAATENRIDSSLILWLVEIDNQMMIELELMLLLMNSVVIVKIVELVLF